MHHNTLGKIEFKSRLATIRPSVDFLIVDPDNELYAANVIGEKSKEFTQFLSLFQEVKNGKYTRYHKRRENQKEMCRYPLKISKANQFFVEHSKNAEIESALFLHKSVFFDPTDTEKNEQQLIISDNRNLDDVLFEAIMDRYSTPIDLSWKQELIHLLKTKSFIKNLDVLTYVNHRNIQACILQITETQLEKIISTAIKDYTFNFALIRDGRTDEEAILPKIQSLDAYMDHFGADLAQIVQSHTDTRFNPETDKHSPAFYTTNRTANENGLTGLYPPQADVVMAAVKTLQKEKFTMVIAEPGCGKTPIGTIIPFIAESDAIQSNTARPYRTLVMAPGKVLHHWKTQILERIPGSSVKIIHRWEDCIPLCKEPKVPNQIEYYLISTNACSDSFPLEPIPAWHDGKNDVLTQKQKGQRSKFIIQQNVLGLGRNQHKLDLIGGYMCPDCMKPLLARKDLRAEKDFFIQPNKNLKGWTYKFNDVNQKCKNKINRNESKHLKKEVLRRADSTQNTFKCNAVLWGAQHKPYDSLERKVSPAWYINKHLPRGFFKYLIVDEVHEMKAADSDRATAFGQLINHATKKILLTGTLVGGMARDIFYLLARLDSRRLKREGITFRDKAKFIERYGACEIIDTQNASVRKIERPGISPLVFTRFLINNCIFLNLANLGYTMQPYQELPVFVNLNPDQQLEYHHMEEKLSGYMGQGVFNGNMSMLSKYLITMQVYCDYPFDLDPISYKTKQGIERILHVPQRVNRNAYHNPKLNKLKEMIDDQIARDRKTMVYVRFSGRYKVDNYLYEELKKSGYKVGILKSNGSVDGLKFPNEEDREQWLRDMQEKNDWDVLICNYELVKVGMNLLMYPTIVFYQNDYNTYTYMQASRRSWRIGQTKPVEVYNLVYENTIQSDILQAVAKKMDAALTIQGKFSEEGIRAMAESTDGIASLAKRLYKEGRLDTMDSIEQKWKAINDSRLHMQDVKLKGYEHYTIDIMNPLGIDELRRKAQDMSKVKKEQRLSGAISQAEYKAYFDQLTNVISLITEDEVQKYNKMVGKKNRIDEGQALFSF